MNPSEIVYGLHAVQAVLAKDPSRVLRVYVLRGREDGRVVALLAAAAATQVTVERVDAARLARLAGDAVHQGVVAEVRPVVPWDEDRLSAELVRLQDPAVVAAAAGGRYAPLLLALDGVQDPHNLGACLRTADACGALAVLIPRDRAAQPNATMRKVAAGAAETTPIVVVTNLARCLRDLKQAGLWVVGAEAGAQKRAADVDMTGATVIVMGAEGGGLRQLTRQHCDLLVRLPSLGAVESLNVSVAAGMLLYEAQRQRGA